MKDGPISKLLIIKTGHKFTQYKKITDTLPVLYAGKNFQGLDEVIQTGHNLVETDFMPTYPNFTQWSTTHYVQVSTVNQKYPPDAITGECPPILKSRVLQVVLLFKFQHSLKTEKMLLQKKSCWPKTVC